jgi:beta-lactamase superfamily II metal-dependent hydrolase
MNDMEIHFINVGCGNMTLLLFPNGTTWLYDCNVTDKNEREVLAYLAKAMGQRTKIHAFICSHRDADHMNGIKSVHDKFPLGGIWDNGVEGTTTDSPEYRAYMDLRRQLKNGEIRSGTSTAIGDITVSWMHSKDKDYSDANDQSIVAKVAFKGSSALMAADTSYAPWRDKLVRDYGTNLKADILLAAHHGSLTFFDDPSDTKNYYTSHIRTITPAMTIVSAGPNVHDLPDKKAIELYAKYSTGSKRGNKVFTTEEKGNMKLLLQADGAWTLNVNQ